MSIPDIGPRDGTTRFKELHRKLEEAVAHIQQMEDVSETLHSILELLISRFEHELEFEGGRVYERRGGEFYLCCAVGGARHAPLGLRVPPDYPPHLHLLRHGLVIMQRGDRGFDEEFETAIGVGPTFAAIGVGEGITHIIGFSIKGRPREAELFYSLTVVRHVINMKIQQQHFAGLIEAARIVQESLLPKSAPQFTGFEIAGRSQPAEIVSGDLFDYSMVSECCIGLAVADSSGHGLPAAMLARDVITSLRMAAGEGQDVAVMMTRLNKVIHQAALSATFVSLFYGQLSADGELVYSNAGHEPPLLIRAGSPVWLDRGGTVLGPIPAATYEEGTIKLLSGDLLVCFTDGIVEREDPSGEQFGIRRLEQLLLDMATETPEAVVDATFREVVRFGGGAPVGDDMTVVAVRRI